MWKTELKSIDGSRGKWIFILLTALFTFLFINVFEPFDTYASSSKDVITQFLEISIATIGMVGASAFAHFVLRRLLGIPTFSYLTILPWFFLELVLISLTWTLLTVMADGLQDGFFRLFADNCVESLFLVSLPYWAVLIFLNTRHQLRGQQEAVDPNAMIVFREKSGKEKLSLPLRSVLYLESSGNYITVYFLENEEVQQFILRNTLKNLESELLAYGLIRCHRSFIVHTRNIVRMEKGSNGFSLVMKQHATGVVPVSKSYTSEMDKITRSMSKGKTQ